MGDEAQGYVDSRQTNDEVDFETLAGLLDTALSSDNPAVQDQLKKLLMVAALTSSPDPLGKVHGPFKQMFGEMRVLSSRVKLLEAVIDQARGPRIDYPDYTPDRSVSMASKEKIEAMMEELRKNPTILPGVQGPGRLMKKEGK